MHRRGIFRPQGGLQPLFRQLSQPEYEAVQAPVAGFFKAFGELGKLHEPGPALVPVPHGAAEGQQVQLLQEKLHQLRGPQIRRDGPQPLQLLQEIPPRGMVPGPEGQGGIEVRLGGRGPDGGQGVRVKAQSGRAEHGDQGNILMGIVQHRQHGQHRGDLNGAEEAVSLPKAHGDALAQKLPPVDGAHAVGAAQQDGDVAVIQGAGTLPVVHQDVLGHEAADLSRHKLCLQGLLVRGFLLALGLCQGQQGQLRHGDAAAVVQGTVAQGGVLIIIQLSQRPGHAAGEHGVGRVQHLTPGAEILPQQDAPGLARGGGLHRLEGVVFFCKDPGIRQAEAVDGLLHVAHQEEVGPVPAEGTKYLVLHPAHVLVFVHQDLLPALPRLQGKLRGRAVLLQQKRCAEVFQVRVVQKIGPALGCGEGFVEVLLQQQQGLHGRGRKSPVPQQLLRGLGKELFELVHVRFAQLPPGLQAVTEDLVRRFAQGANLEGDGKAGSCRLPALIQGTAESVQSISGLGIALLPGLGDGGLRVDEAQHPLKFRGPKGGGLLGKAQDLPAPGGVARVLRALFQGTDLALGPERGPGVALHLAVELQHQLLQPFVVSAGAYGIRQLQKARVLLRRVVPGVQHFFESPGHHASGPLLVQHGKVRPDLGLVAVLAEKGGTEGVDGTDLGPVEQGALPPEAAVHGVGCQGRGQLLHDAAAQLSRRRPGIGDDQEAVQIHGPLRVGDRTHQPLGEDPGLAAAGAGGDQQRAAPALYRGLLGRGGFEFRHGLPPFLSAPRPCRR